MKYLATTILALTGIAIMTPAARAQNYTSGDLVIGFSNSTSDYDYTVNLGSDANFLPLGMQGFGTGLYVTGGPVTLLSGSAFAADLSTAGLSPGFNFGVFGDDKVNVKALFGTGATAQSDPSLSAYTTPYSKVESFGAQFNKGLDQLDGSNPNQTLGTVSNSVIQHIIADSNPNVAPNNFVTYTTSSPYFGFFQTPAEATYTPGTTSANLSLFEYTAGGGTTGVLLGEIEITSTGAVQFTSSAVPEPSALGALLAGAGLLGFVRRRRTATIG